MSDGKEDCKSHFSLRPRGAVGARLAGWCTCCGSAVPKQQLFLEAIAGLSTPRLPGLAFALHLRSLLLTGTLSGPPRGHILVLSEPLITGCSFFMLRSAPGHTAASQPSDRTNLSQQQRRAGVWGQVHKSCHGKKGVSS